MKRLSYVLALAAVLAVAGTAAASPSLTISGSASLSLSGELGGDGNASPTVGDLSFGWNHAFSVSDGDNWSLSGTLGTPYNGLTGWKLYVHPGLLKVYVANGADLTGYGTESGWASFAAQPSGNHLQVVVPFSPFTLVYDKANSSPTTTSQEGVYAQIDKSEAIPLTVKAIYLTSKKLVAATGKYEWGSGYSLIAGGAIQQGVQDGLAYGAELTVPATKDLQAYIVAKQQGAGYLGGGATAAVQPTLVRLTYTQPQYRSVAYIWTKFSNGAVAARNYYVNLSVLLSAADAKYYDWYWDSNGDGANTEYRNLKGPAVYAKAQLADTKGLNLIAAAPVLGGKGAVKVEVPDALATQPTVNGEFFLKLTPKLTSTTNTSYTSQVGFGDITDNLNYSLSGSSSIGISLTKPATKSVLDYGVKFTVSY